MPFVWNEYRFCFCLNGTFYLTKISIEVVKISFYDWKKISFLFSLPFFPFFVSAYPSIWLKSRRTLPFHTHTHAHTHSHAYQYKIKSDAFALENRMKENFFFNGALHSMSAQIGMDSIAIGRNKSMWQVNYELYVKIMWKIEAR